MDSKSAKNSALFVTHIEFLLKKNVGVLLALFANFEVEFEQTAQKDEISLRIKFFTNDWPGRTILLKSLYPNTQPQSHHISQLRIQPDHCSGGNN